MNANDEGYVLNGAETEYKLGHGNADARRRACQTGNAVRLTLVVSYPGGEVLEKFWHKLFRNRHICRKVFCNHGPGTGEWYRFENDKEVMDLTAQAARDLAELRLKHPSFKPEMLVNMIIAQA